MRFLVTGGAGFIGSNYVRHLLATDPQARVTNFDRLTNAGNRASVADLEGDPRHRFVQGDICDPDQVAQVMAGQDLVVNFAVGTDEEYGTIGDGSFAEDDRLEPSSPYSAGKAGGSLVALAYAATHKLDDFDQGLAETIAWYREHEDWWRPLKPPGANRTLDHGR